MAKKKEEGNEGEFDQEQVAADLVKVLNKKGKVAYLYDDKEDPSLVKYWISTGSTLLDYIISNRRNGGVPFGRITILNGIEGSGKSLIATTLCANTQKMGGFAVLLDTENAYDADFGKRLGIQEKKLVHSNPSTLEESFQLIEDSIVHLKSRKSNKEAPILIVMDSLAATPPAAELESDYNPASQMGIGAKAVAKGLRKLTKTIGIESVALVFTNQLKYNMQMANKYSDPYIMPYGKAASYMASVIVRLKAGEKIKTDTKEILGVWCEAQTTKNRFTNPYRKVSFPLMFDWGCDDSQSIYNYLHEKEIIKKVAGYSKFSVGGQDFSIPNSEWKSWFSEGENKEKILSLIEEKMVIKYDESASVEDIPMEEEKSGDFVGEE